MNAPKAVTKAGLGIRVALILMLLAGPVARSSGLWPLTQLILR